jgi:[ribosomal protein S18]-alanine N-acetyltransferase
VTVREATGTEHAAVMELLQAYMDELWERPFPPGPLDPGALTGKVVLVAEDEAEIVGAVFGDVAVPDRPAHLSFVYVRPDRRGRGIGRELVRAFVSAAAAGGDGHVVLDVDTTNEPAQALWRRLGFVEFARRLVAPVPALAERLEARGGATFGSAHVQTDDLGGVERAARTFIPRLGRSAGSAVVPPRNGWIGVYDELCGREPELLRRLARELSDRFGVALAIGVEAGQVVRYVLFDRGRMVDEYLSVPEFHGPLPPGDVIALGANPTLLARLTGADPARVRAVARTAASPADLPPAEELVAGIGELLGLSGAELGYDDALELPGVLRIER